MDIVNETPFAAGLLAFDLPPHGEAMTVVVKGTFDVAKATQAALAAAQQPLSTDVFEAGDPESAVVYEDDHAPYKARADLLVRGPSPSATDPDAPGHGRVGIGAHSARLADFGPRPRAGGERAALAGDHGGDWFATHWPRLGDGYPLDYFNAARPEMQLNGYLNGDESVVMEGLHKEYERFETWLPGLRPRVFIHRDDDSFEEATANLDTLWLDAQAGVLILVWRALVPMAGGWATPECRVLIVSEPLNAPRQPAAAYRDRLRKAKAAAPEPPEVDRAMAEAGVSPNEMPPEVLGFLRDPEAGADGLSANPDLAEFSAPDPGDGEVEDRPAAASEMMAAGMSADQAPASTLDPTAAAADPGLAAQSGLDDTRVSALAAQEGAGLTEMPAQIVAFMDNPALGNAGLIELLKADDSPAARKIVADAAKQPPPPKPPSPEEISTAMNAVPHWPPQDPEQAKSIETLTATFGAGRPPEGDGADFLVVLAGLAGAPRKETEANGNRQG